MPKRKTFTGGCLCGNITFRVEGPPVWPHYCSCTMCQKWSGAPAMGWVDFHLAGLAWTRGTPKLLRTTQKTQRGFCPDCGSGLFAQDDASDTICLTIGVIDQKNSLVPESHSYRGKAPKWLCLAVPEPKSDA